jgi:hypothetical protein
MDEDNQKQCAECGKWYWVGFFRKNGSRGASAPRWRAVCIGCEQTARDTEKRKNRWIPKALWALRRHATKYRKRGEVASVADFRQRFGWDHLRIAGDFAHAYAGRCPACREPFAEMLNGFRSITLAVHDRSKPPYYGSNTRMLCTACNARTQRTPPEERDQERLCWDKWDQRQKALAGGGTPPLEEKPEGEGTA